MVKPSIGWPVSARSVTGGLATCGSLIWKQGPSTERQIWSSCEWREQLWVKRITRAVPVIRAKPEIYLASRSRCPVEYIRIKQGRVCPYDISSTGDDPFNGADR